MCMDGYYYNNICHDFSYVILHMLKSYVKAAVLVIPTLLFGLDAEPPLIGSLYFSCFERA